MLRKFRTVIILTIVTAVIGFSYSFYEARNIGVVKYDFSSPHLPPAFDGKKVVFVSDMHCNVHFTPEMVGELVERVNKLKPDIILLGGDYVDKDSTFSVPFFKEIEKLKAPHGVYTVLGNHDFWEDAELIQKGLTDCGFRKCDNLSYWIYEGSDSIKIGGVGDLWEDSQTIENTVSDIDETDFCILLSHNPDYIEMMDTDKVDLILSGHTHAGQVTLFGQYAPVMPSYWRPKVPNTGQKYRYGWIQKDNIQLYVTTGVGMGEFPFRFFAFPEIVEITLKREK